MQSFAGSPRVKNLPRVNIQKCVHHKRDFSWRKDLGIAENGGNWRNDWNSNIKCTFRN